MGFTVPDDLSIVGWDDSLISQVVHPPLTAITRDIEALRRRGRRGASSRRSTGARPEDVETHARRAHDRAAAPPCALRVDGSARETELTLNRISDGVHTVTLDGSAIAFDAGSSAPRPPRDLAQANQTEAPTSRARGGNRPRRDTERCSDVGLKGVAGAIVVFVAVAAASLGVAGAGASEQDAFALPRAPDLLHER